MPYIHRRPSHLKVNIKMEKHTTRSLGLGTRICSQPPVAFSKLISSTQNWLAFPAIILRAGYGMNKPCNVFCNIDLYIEIVKENTHLVHFGSQSGGKLQCRSPPVTLTAVAWAPWQCSSVTRTRNLCPGRHPVLPFQVPFLSTTGLGCRFLESFRKVQNQSHEQSCRKNLLENLSAVYVCVLQFSETGRTQLPR